MKKEYAIDVKKFWLMNNLKCIISSPQSKKKMLTDRYLTCFKFISEILLQIPILDSNYFQ